MNFLKRAIVNTYRQPIKSSIFLFLVILLGILTSGAISVKQAIVNTDQNLRRRMPAVVIVVQDFNYEESFAIYEETGEWPEIEIERFTPELIREIGALPQVRVYDYTIDLSWGVTGRGLRMWENPDFPDAPALGEYDEVLGVRLRIRGVSDPNFIETREGLIELVEGRNFDEHEMYHFNDVFPALIASGFARTNNLELESVFNAQVVVYDNNLHDAEIFFKEDFSFEVIGIFEPVFNDTADTDDMGALFQADRYQMIMQHRVYVPNAVAEKMFNVRAENDWEMDEVFLQNFFVLNDPMDFQDFVAEVENLPGNWDVMDLSSGFAEISASMENILELADMILIISLGATLLIISLLVILLLRERKYEIGIYLALGEKKKKIIMQMISELIPLALIGIAIALFLGNILASQISQEMLRQDLETQPIFAEWNPLEELGYRFNLTHDEMLESYEVRLDTETVVLFYAVGLGVISVAIIIPIIHATNVNPKKLLTLNERS